MFLAALEQYDGGERAIVALVTFVVAGLAGALLLAAIRTARRERLAEEVSPHG